MATSDDHRFKPIYSLIVVVLKPLPKDCRGNVVVFPFRYRIIQDDDGSSIKDFQWIHHCYQLLYPTFTWLAHSIPSSWVEETAAHTVTLHNENSSKLAITYWLISIYHSENGNFLKPVWLSWNTSDSVWNLSETWSPSGNSSNLKYVWNSSSETTSGILKPTGYASEIKADK